MDVPTLSTLQPTKRGCFFMQGLKDGQILRTISNVTYSESHYASDEDKTPLEVRAWSMNVQSRVPSYCTRAKGAGWSVVELAHNV